MFTGVFASQHYSNQSIADMGGRQILGMSGSLINYINTGKIKADSFESASKQPQAQAKKKSNAAKIAGYAAAALAAIGGTVFAFKKGGKFIDKLKTRFSKNGAEGGKFIDKIKAHFKKNKAENAKTKSFVDGLKEKFNNLKNKKASSK